MEKTITDLLDLLHILEYTPELEFTIHINTVTKPFYSVTFNCTTTSENTWYYTISHLPTLEATQQAVISEIKNSIKYHIKLNDITDTRAIDLYKRYI